MKSFEYRAECEMGLHVRPLGLIAKEAKKYRSKIYIKKGEKKAEITRLMLVMNLDIKCNEKFTIVIEGEDEEIAFEELKVFLKECML